MPYVFLKKINKIVDPLLKPLVLRIHGLGVTASHLTLTGLFFGVLGVALLYTKPLISLPLLLLYVLCDTLDGVLARQSQTQSSRGQSLDYNVDRLIALLFLLNYLLHTKQIILPATGFSILALIWLDEQKTRLTAS